EERVFRLEDIVSERPHNEEESRNKHQEYIAVRERDHAAPKTEDRGQKTEDREQRTGHSVLIQTLGEAVRLVGPASRRSRRKRPAGRRSHQTVSPNACISLLSSEVALGPLAIPRVNALAGG